MTQFTDLPWDLIRLLTTALVLSDVEALRGVNPDTHRAIDHQTLTALMIEREDLTNAVRRGDATAVCMILTRWKASNSRTRSCSIKRQTIADVIVTATIRGHYDIVEMLLKFSGPRRQIAMGWISSLQSTVQHDRLDLFSLILDHLSIKRLEKLESKGLNLYDIFKNVLLSMPMTNRQRPWSTPTIQTENVEKFNALLKVMKDPVRRERWGRYASSIESEYADWL